ncbi:hypothetical protein H8959_001623, partial [Pygathrix nigripes]
MDSHQGQNLGPVVVCFSSFSVSSEECISSKSPKPLGGPCRWLSDVGCLPRWTLHSPLTACSLASPSMVLGDIKLPVSDPVSLPITGLVCGLALRSVSLLVTCPQTSLFAHQLLLPLYRRFPGQVAAFVTLLLCVLSAGLLPHAAVDFHCWMCGKNCNSEKQWQGHISSEKHKEKVFHTEDDQYCWQHRFPTGYFSICD